MNRDDIIRMAREAGFSLKNFAEPPKPYLHVYGYGDALERFAVLVADAERDACAKVCENEGARIDASWTSCAAAIRARSNP